MIGQSIVTRARADRSHYAPLVAGLLDVGMSSLATFAIGIYAARTLPPAVLGAYAMVFAAFILATIIPIQLVYTPLEVATVARPRTERLPLLPHNLRLAALPSLLAAVCIVGWCAFAPREVGGAALVALTVTGALCTPLSPAQDHLRRVLHMAGKSWRAAAVSGVQLAAAVGALAVARAASIPFAWVPFGALTAANLLSLCGGLLLARETPSRTGAERPPVAPPPSPRLASVLRSGRWLLVAGLVPNVATFLAAALVARMAGAAAVGYAEAARVGGQPLLVLSNALTATLGAQIVGGVQRGEIAEARRAERRFIALMLVAGILYAALTAAPHRLNPLALLLPKAYAIPGLLAVTILANLLQGASYAPRAGLLGLHRESSFVLVELIGNAIRLAVAAAAGLLGASAVPWGGVAVGATRMFGYRRSFGGASSAMAAATDDADGAVADERRLVARGSVAAGPVGGQPRASD